MLGKISNRLMDSLEAKEKPYQVHDTEINRFFVRVQPTGMMIYYCNVNLVNGKRTARKIGKHGVLTPSQAREEAKKIIGDAARGIDPDAAKKSARQYTLRKFLDEKYEPWLTARQKKGDPRLDAKAEKRAEATISMIESSFGEFLPKKLSELNSWIIEKWKMANLNKGSKPATINRKMDALRAALSKS